MPFARKLLLASVALSAAGVSACASTRAPATPPVAIFDVTAFAWSTMSGPNAVSGQLAYAGGGRTWRCAGSVGLTPETPWTRQRFATLYGSTERAAAPAAVVRARTVAEASDDYRAFVRNTTCDSAGRFRFDGLPDGAWFLISPATAGQEGDTVVLMRRVTTRGGQITDVRLD